MAARRDLALSQRGEHGAARLAQVGAVVEAAIADMGAELREAPLQLLLGDGLHLGQVKGRKARRVRDERAVPDVEKLDVARGVPSAAKAVADLADGEVKFRGDAV